MQYETLGNRMRVLVLICYHATGTSSIGYAQTAESEAVALL